MSIPLRVLYGLNGDGTPKRVSMFPPSYADRARARERQRRQALHPDPAADPPDLRTPNKSAKRATTTVPTKNGNFSNAGAQTDLSYCAHHCTAHKKANAANTVKSTDKDGRSVQATGGETAKQKGKGKQQKGKKNGTRDSEDETGSDTTVSTSEVAAVKPSKKFAQGEKSEYKHSKKKGAAASTVWDPATLPWLASLVPDAANMAAEDKKAMAAATKKMREALVAARKADEGEAQRWITQQQATTHHGALKWLRERDVMRQNSSAQASLLEVDALSAALAGIVQNKTKKKHVFFNRPMDTTTPNPNRPLWAIESDSDSDEQGQAGFLKGPASGKFVVYRDNDMMFTSDGHPVQIVDKNMQGSGPGNQGNRRHGRVLQEISTNAGGKGWVPQSSEGNQPQGRQESNVKWQSNRQSSQGQNSNQAYRHNNSEWANTVNNNQNFNNDQGYNDNSGQGRHNGSLSGSNNGAGGYSGSPDQGKEEREMDQWIQTESGNNGQTTQRDSGGWGQPIDNTGGNAGRPSTPVEAAFPW